MSITDHPRLQSILAKLRRHGWRNVLHLAFLELINLALPVQILRAFRAERPNLAHMACPAGYTAGFASAAELARFAREPENELSPQFIADALGAGDKCYAIVHGDKLAAYGWCSTRPTPIGLPGLVLHFKSGYAYRYKGFTAAQHRGKRLHALGFARTSSSRQRRKGAAPRSGRLVLVVPTRRRTPNLCTRSTVVGNPMSPHFLRAAVRKGDACYAVCEGTKLVSSAWFSTRPTSIGSSRPSAALRCRVRLYVQGSHLRAYRGQRLLRGRHRRARPGALPRRRAPAGFVSYVEATNLDSLKACACAWVTGSSARSTCSGCSAAISLSPAPAAAPSASASSSV